MIARPWLHRVLAQTSWETRATLRNGEQILLCVLLPVITFLAFMHAPASLTGATDTNQVGAALAVALSMATLSTAFTGQAIATGFDRRQGVLRLLGISPLGKAGWVTARSLSVLAVLGAPLLVLCTLALCFGWRPTAAIIVIAVPALLLGTVGLTALGLLLAGTMRAEAVLAVANIVWVLLVLGGGVVVQAHRLPAALAHIAPWLPSGALTDLLRVALGQPGSVTLPVLVLTGWTVAAVAACARWFSWR